MKKIIVIILAVMLVTGMCAAPASAAGKALTYNELDEMIKTADFVCDMYYAENFRDYPTIIVETLNKMFPETNRYSKEYGISYVFVTEEQLWQGINEKWPGVSDVVVNKLYIPNLSYEADNGHYVIFYPAKGGYDFYKECAKGEFTGYTCNDDGTYSVYFKVPLPDEEVEIAGLDDLAGEMGWPDLIEYNGTIYIDNWYGYSTIKYENRVFNFKLSDGKADYISDEWNPTIPAKLSAMPAKSVRGDVSGDGEANNKDVVELFRYASGNKKVDDETAYDFNGDGEVNNKDVVELFRYLSSGAPSDTETEPDTTESEAQESVTEPEGPADDTEETSEPEESSEPEVSSEPEETSEPESSSEPEESSEPESSGEPEESSSEESETVDPDKTLTYVTADVYADKATAEKEGFKKAVDEDVCNWFGGKKDIDLNTFEIVYILPEAFDYVEGFILRKALGQYIEEVTVLKVKEGGSAEDVRNMLDERREKQKNNADYKLYDDEDHRNEKMLDTGAVKIVGNFVVYAVTEDTAVSIKRAENYVAANPNCSAAELYKAIVKELYSE